jgi:hypothetical protein
MKPEPKKIGVLTAREIRNLDVISRDRETLDHTLQIALQFHANSQLKIVDAEKEFWDGLGERMGFDYRCPPPYKIAIVEGEVCVVAVTYGDVSREKT